MKRFLSLLILPLFFGCEPADDSAALRSTIYTLYQANYNPTSGELKVTELSPGVLEFRINLKNTNANIEHPAHLHFGTVSEVGELAFALNPVDGTTGKSVTVLDRVLMSDSSVLTYDSFLTMDGSVKIHMNDNFFRHIVLASGNVGKNEEYFFTGVSVCTGH